MKILFVMPRVGAWATHGKHLAPNQLYASLGRLYSRKRLSGYRGFGLQGSGDTERRNGGKSQREKSGCSGYW